jgi:molecular chaperone GrpE
MEHPQAPQEEAPPALEDQLEALRAELEEANRERGEFKSLLQRVQADFINYRRRVEEEREEYQRQANARLILKLLPVLDEFSLALDHAARTEAEVPFLEGVRLIHRKLLALLESEGVSRIEALGKGFDPWEHEAMAYQETNECEEGKVVMVLRDGYKLHGRLLRPAQVVVAKRPEPSKEVKED